MNCTSHKIIVCITFLCATICAFSQNTINIEDLLLKEIESTITENLTTEQAINDSLINSINTVIGDAIANYSGGLTVPIDSLIAFGKTFVGLPYRSKIEGVPQLMDCSGYMGMLFQTFGVTLPRSSAEIANVTQKIPLKEAQVGDFIFFMGRSINNRVGHVALIIENNDGVLQMMHSSVSKGITIDTYPDTHYYYKRFVKVGRL
ncbi:MAG: C40 family peptidase [Bacteroidetes bacterium]|nr:C40 family peptidase [Bacteroidota bacterium]